MNNPGQGGAEQAEFHGEKTNNNFYHLLREIRFTLCLFVKNV